MKNKDDEQALKAFEQDISCLDALQPWLHKKVNIFDVLKISRAEIRHSNMLAWLLDPNENHGLGDVFLRQFLTRCELPVPADLSAFSVRREWCHIDLLLESPGMVVVIENKIDSHEHDTTGGCSQLKKYREVIDTHFSSKVSKHYIFLSPFGELPSEEEQKFWTVCDYGIILKIFKELPIYDVESIPRESALLILNYSEVLTKQIIMDTELINVCRQIYKKHKRALDLIFENREDDRQAAFDICVEVLNAKKEEYKIDHNSSYDGGCTYLRFVTKSLREYMSGVLPTKDSLSDWRTDFALCYEVCFRSDAESDNVIITLKAVANCNTSMDKPLLLSKLRPLARKLRENFQWQGIQDFGKGSYDIENVASHFGRMLTNAMKWEEKNIR